MPINAFKIVYENVTDYNGKIRVSFEIVLASDLKGTSYVTLKYASCGNMESLYSPPSLYYIDSLGKLVDILVNVSPCDSSNVNLKGTWIFDVNSFDCKFIVKMMVL